MTNKVIHACMHAHNSSRGANSACTKNSVHVPKAWSDPKSGAVFFFLYIYTVDPVDASIDIQNKTLTIAQFAEKNN